jgi:hypothetical protein
MVTNDKMQKMNFNVDPVRTPVLYADGYLVASNENAITLSFTQAMLAPGQQQVVSRIALTRNQAKEFAKNLTDHIEKFEI